MVNKLILLLSFLLLTCSPADVSTKANTQAFKSFKLDSGIFTTNISVIVSSDYIWVSNTLKEAYNIDMPSKDLIAAEGYTFSTNNSCVIWLDSVTDTPCDKAKVAHELFHATAYILSYHGVELDLSSEEVFAYELDYLTEQFYNNYGK